MMQFFHNYRFIILLFITNTFITDSHAASRYWVSSSSGNWNAPSNWSATSGGTGGATVPSASDQVYFNNLKNGNCTINSTVNVFGLNIDGYSGTITNTTYAITVSANDYFIQTSGTFNGGNSNITINNQFRISGGTFNSGNGTVDINSGFYLTGGTFTATTGNHFQSGLWEHTAGTFNHNNGTLIFDGAITTSNQKIQIPSNSETFYNLNFAATSGYKLMYQVNDIILILGTLTLESGGVSAWNGGSTYTMDLRGNVNVLSAFGSIQNVTLNFTGSANQNFDLTGASDKIDGPIDITKSGGQVNLLSSITLDYGVPLNLNSGILNLNGYTLSKTAGITNLNGIFSLAGTGNMENYGWVQSNAAGAFTITSTPTLSIGGGFFKQSNGVFSANTATLDFNGHFYLSGGTFNSTSGNFYLSGLWEHTTSGTFNHNNGTMIFDGVITTSNRKIQILNNSETFYNLIFDMSSGTKLLYSENDNLIILGTLNLKSGSIGAWSNSFHSLEARGNVNVLNTFGTIQDVAIKFAGNASLQNFDLSNATDKVDGDVIINKSSGEVKMLSNLTMNYAYTQYLTLTSGNLNLNNQTINSSPYGTFNVNGTCNVTGPGEITSYIYNQTAGTITFLGSGIFVHQTYDFTLTGGTFNGGTITLDVDRIFSLSNGVFNASSGNMYVGAGWYHPSSGTFNHLSGTVIFDGDHTNWFLMDFISQETFYNVIYNKTGCKFNKIAPYDNMLVEGNIIFRSGYLWSKGWENYGIKNEIRVKGNVSVESTYCAGSYPPTLLFICNDAQILDLSGATGGYDGQIIINKAGGQVTLSSDLALNNSGGQNLTIGNGILNLNGKTITIGSNSSVIKYSGGTLVYNGGAINGGSVTNNSGAYAFDPNNCNALPVKLIHFVSKYHDKFVTLSWETASEINNERFEIERSLDEKIWEKIGEVYGNGNSNTIKYYTFNDRSIPTMVKVIFYRLKQVDYDGEFEYSPVVVEDFNGSRFINGGFTLYPNPANDWITVKNINFIKSESRYEIIDLTGKKWLSDSFANQATLDLSKLVSGMYIFNIYNLEGENVNREKISVSR